MCKTEFLGMLREDYGGVIFYPGGNDGVKC